MTVATAITATRCDSDQRRIQSIMASPSVRVPVGRNGAARRGELDRPGSAADNVLAGAHARDDLDRAPVTSPEPDHSPLEGFALDLDEHDADPAIIHERRLRHSECVTFVSMHEKRTGE